MRTWRRSGTVKVGACLAAAFLVGAAGSVGAQVADLSRYRIKRERPRIWLTPTLLGRLKAKAAAGDKVILRLKPAGRLYDVSFSTKEACGGSISRGDALPVRFPEKIVPRGILINKP